MDDADEFAIALGDEVRAWRRRKRLTIPELAELAGVGRSTIQRLEAGTHSTSVPNTWAVARALDVPLATLVRRAEEAIEETRLRAAQSAKSDADVAQIKAEAERLDISVTRYGDEFGYDFELAETALKLERLRSARRRRQGDGSPAVADVAARDEDRD